MSTWYGYDHSGVLNLTPVAQSHKFSDVVVEVGVGFMNDDTLDRKLVVAHMLHSKAAESGVAQNRFVGDVPLHHIPRLDRGAKPTRYERQGIRSL